MSRERFNVRFDEFLSAQEGKNSRVMTDEEHAAAVDFILRSEASEVLPEEGKHRRWHSFSGLRREGQPHDPGEAIRVDA